MTDAEIARRLQVVASLRTRSRGVRNEVVSVGPTSVTVRSERPHSGAARKDRTVTFDEIRRATENGEDRAHSAIIGTLRQLLGLTGDC